MKKIVLIISLSAFIICYMLTNISYAEDNEVEDVTNKNIMQEETISESATDEIQQTIEYNEEVEEEQVETDNEEKEEQSDKEEEQAESDEVERSLDDGVYTISTRLNSTKVISIEDESKNSGANVHLWGDVNLDYQHFQVTYLKDGYYSIICVDSEKSLDVYHAGTTSGTNIAQGDYRGSSTQQWYIKDAGNGYYFIISKWNNLSVDVYHASIDNGTNIQMSNFTGSQAQQFLFSKVQETQRTIEDGVYTIASKINENKALDVNGASLSHGANVQLWDREYVLQQQMEIKYLNNGFYSIKFMHSGHSLDADKAGWYHGTNIAQSTYTGRSAQQWIIKDLGNGYYSIICRCNGLYMDVYHASMDNGTNISLCDYNGNSAQQFTFIPITEILSKSIDSGTYQIMTKLNSNYTVEVSEASKSDRANIQIWSNVEEAHQIFKITYLNNGYYIIESLYTGKVLDIQDENKESGANIVQNTNDGSISQQWIIRKTDDGYYLLISRLSGLYMDIKWAEVYNGNNVETSIGNSSDAQKYSFKAVDAIEVESGVYGVSGLRIKGDSRGSELKYYKIGNGPNVFFATFAVHGFEDLWNYDGQELTKIAEKFVDKLFSIQDKDLANKWTIYVFPSVNPDGEYYGYTNNGPGRTSLYSASSSHQGIDINRTWSTGWTKYTSARNYNGTSSFQAYEAQYLRDFLLNHRATNGQTVLVDLHGWLNETIGDNEIGSYYRSQYGISKHISTYGNGYLVNWARSNLGYNGITARSTLVELPEYDTNADKYINATINMLSEL